jgi:hypothetical protein
VVRFPLEEKGFYLLRNVQTVSRAHMAYCLVGKRLFPMHTKRTGREIYHLYPSRAEGKNEWSYTSALAYAFMARTGAS